MSCCTDCGADLSPGARFCRECGAQRVAVPASEPPSNQSASCVSCGAAMPGSASFCRSCGAPQSETATGPDGRVVLGAERVDLDDVTDDSASRCEVCGSAVGRGETMCEACAPLSGLGAHRAALGSVVRVPGPTSEWTIADAMRAPALAPVPPQGAERRGGFSVILVAIVIIFGGAGGTAVYLLALKPHKQTSASRGATSVTAGPARPGKIIVKRAGGAPAAKSDPAGKGAGAGAGAGESATADDWPDGRPGYTVLLAAMGDRGGANRVVAGAARQHLSAGILRSDDYPTLNPGYWVVFHGSYDARADALGALPAAQRAGFKDAYVRYVSREDPLYPSEAAGAGTARYRQYQNKAYSMAVPALWSTVADEVDVGYGLRDKWRPSQGGRAFLLVDRTQGIRGSAADAARGVRGGTRRSVGYRERHFRRITLGGKAAVEWRFSIGGLEKVDYFVNACGTGFAVLGAAPPRQFATYLADFRHAAESLQATC